MKKSAESVSTDKEELFKGLLKLMGYLIVGEMRMGVTYLRFMNDQNITHYLEHNLYSKLKHECEKLVKVWADMLLSFLIRRE